MIEALELRFGELPPEIITRLDGINDVHYLKQLFREAIVAISPEAFMKKIV